MKNLFVNVALTAIMTIGATLPAVAEAPVYTPPVKLEINSEEAFAQWTTFNSNGDAYEFYYSSSVGGAVVDENRSAAANDWLISPAIKVKAGATYTLTVYAKNVSTYSSDKSKIKLMAGNAPTVEAQTKQIFDNTSLSSKYFTTTNNSGTFTAAEDGELYFGVHVYSASYNGGTAIQYLDITEVKSVPGIPNGLTIKAGEKGALEAVLEWTQPTEDQFYGTLTELTGAYVYRGTSQYFTANESSLVGTVEAPTPGQTVTWTDATVPSSGRYYYKLAAFNENGTGMASSSVQSPFIGPATSAPAVTNLVAAAVEGNDKAISLTWTQPESTEGYFDPEKVAYQISRSKDGATATVIEEAWVGEQPYVDATITELGSYKYTVKTVYNGTTAWSGTTSNAVVTGGTASLPYYEDFSSTSSADLYTFFHGPDGSKDWSRNSSGMLDYWGGPTADAWAVTPGFELEAGKAYEVSFKTRITSATEANKKNLAVKIGTSATAEGLTQEGFNETISTALFTDKKFVFSVEKTGVYYVGFYCYGTSNSNDLYVDNIGIQEIVATPLPVTEMTATAGAEGAMEVTVAWTNPTKTTAGETMETVDKVEVRRGTELVATLTEVPAGTQSSVKDTVGESGVYEYTVTPYIGEDAGESAKATTTWVGNDTPKAPASVAVTKLSDDKVEVTFPAVTEGVNGGYVNTDKLRYIVRLNEEELTGDLADTTYVDDVAGLPLALYTYSVGATADGLTSDFTSAPAVQLGDALSLPYEPDFADASTRALYTSTINYYGNPTWSYNSSKGAMYTSSSNSTLMSPPIEMKKGTVSVSWKATCYNYNNQEDFLILLCREARTTEGEAAPKRAASVLGYEVVDTIATPHVSSVSYPSLITDSVSIPEDGKYNIAYHVDTAKWTLYLYQADVKQTMITSGVNDVAGNTAGSLVYNHADRSVTASGAGRLTVYTVAGAVVLDKAVTEDTAVSLGGLTAGLYVARWTGDDGEVSTLKLNL